MATAILAIAATATATAFAMRSLKKLNAAAGTSFTRWKQVTKALRGKRHLNICDVDPCDGPCACKKEDKR